MRTASDGGMLGPDDFGQERQVRLRTAMFESKSLGRAARYRILFPLEYETSAKHYPVLYLLHGMYGDCTNWSELTNLVAVSRRSPFLIVMPDAGNSWYVNSYSNPSDRFEDFVIRDLLAEIDSLYRTVPQRDSRAVAGLSMGGYGSVKFGFQYPESFAFAGSLCGAFNAPTDLDKNSEFREVLTQAFGPRGHSRREDNNVYALAAAASAGAATPAGPKLPYFYLDCGIGDAEFLEPNRQLAVLLQKRQIAYEYHELPGAHDWDYWDKRLVALLDAVANALVV